MRDALEAETSLLTSIVRESGSYSGPHRVIVADQKLDADYLHQSHTRVAIMRGQLCGFYSALRDARGATDLDYLFVHDRFRSHGVGRAMFHDLDRSFAKNGISPIRIIAHPPAEGFYLRMGARRIGTAAPAGVVTWHRPILEYASVQARRPDDDQGEVDEVPEWRACVVRTSGRGQD